MKIAVEGCAHGELDNIYNTIKHLEENEGFKIDLLICCGDFQACRNEEDLRCMAVSPKYYNIRTFYKYYNGERIAPILTIFVGGNHEASNYLQELPYGGWVAPNIYYLGYAGVINIAGLRIGGISGIYKSRDYMRGHFEHSPYNENTKRSVYHIRSLEIFRLKQISQPVDIFISHDWPTGVWNYGNKGQLIRFKPHFKEDIDSGQLGSKPTEEILSVLKPDYWFAAHLHCKFAAVIPHPCGKTTKFLALDKCLPQKRFLQVMEVPHKTDARIEISYDLEWLTILRKTNHLLSVKNIITYLPSPPGPEQWCFVPSKEEKALTLLKFDSDLLTPHNFVKTARAYNTDPNNSTKVCQPAIAVCNPQTILFCEKLLIDDPLNLILNLNDTSKAVTDFSLGDTSSMDDSFASMHSPIPKKLSLVLPEPINESTQFEDCVQDDDDGAAAIEDDKTEAETSTSETTNRKFKRRNASLYQCDQIDSY